MESKRRQRDLPPFSFALFFAMRRFAAGKEKVFAIFVSLAQVSRT
jgi:hypothetical protein